jgi:hypothetical protein
MTKQINAVAIGNVDAPVNHIYNGANLGPPMRQYIKGLVDGMQNTWHWTLSNAAGPTNFFINYWEITEATLNTPGGPAQVFGGDVIFAMSSTVVRYAQTYNGTLATAIPIVGIVSDPQQEGFYNDRHICGFSGQRHQSAAPVFRNFVQSVNPNLTRVVLLHKKNYNPSNQALGRIQAEASKPPQIQLVRLEPTDPGEIAPLLNGLAVQPANTGILVLPADMFFANAASIIDLAQNTGLGASGQKLPTFFFATDWVLSSPQPSAFGACGVPQDTCGSKMADKVNLALTTGVPANAAQRWTYAQLPGPDGPGDFAWVVNTTVAGSLGLIANPQVPPNKVN